MIRPLLQDDAFLADVGAARRGDHGPGPHAWWLGQSGYLVHAGGRFLLLDPYLSDSLTRKYAGTDKPHVRMTGRVVDPARLGFVDVVTASHAHTDHLDPETLRPLAAASPSLRLVCPESIRALALERSGLGERAVIGLDAASPGRSAAAPSLFACAGFEIRAVPAAHEALAPDPGGRLACLGFVVRAGGVTLYHSGDTILYDGMEDVLRAERVDVAFLPINGRAPERRVAGNLWGREAAGLARAIGARLAVPGHHEMFEFNTATPDEFVARCRELGQGFVVPRAGGRIDLRRPD